MAYSRKFNGLFTDTLAYKYIGDCVNSTTEEVYQGLINSFNNLEILQKDIDKSLNDVVIPRIKLLKQRILDMLKN